MTLTDLINLARSEAFDNSTPQLMSDADLTIWLNEAQIEAAIRRRLLRENTSVHLTQFDIRTGVRSYPLDTRMYEIVYARMIFKGANAMLPYELAITSAEELDGVRRLWRSLPFRPQAIIPYDTTLEVDCIPNASYTILTEGYRLPMWSMGSVAVPEILAQGTVTLTGGASGSVDSILVNGIDVLGSSVAFNASLTQTAADVVTQVNTNQNRYLASSVGAVITLADIVGTGALHNGYSVSATSTTITTSSTAFQGGQDAVVTTPEINGVHHRHLVKWALHRAYQRPDAELFNPGKAAAALTEFEEYFGPRPDASNRKKRNASRPHRNTAYS